MPDQSPNPQDNARELPAPVTREHRLFAMRLLDDSRHFDWGVQAWLETGVTAQQSSGFFVIGQTLIEHSNLIASRDASAESRGRLLERADVIRWLRGPGLDGLDQYTLLAVLASIERGDHLAQPKESATPAVEWADLERPCQVCGGDGEEPICIRCGGSGKEPT